MALLMMKEEWQVGEAYVIRVDQSGKKGDQDGVGVKWRRTGIIFCMHCIAYFHYIIYSTIPCSGYMCQYSKFMHHTVPRIAS